ncbi:MAG TPA: DNA-directed RNA polymerase [Candidatus Thorarchaeota archaeon]|nr:MAG: DNA-directed RNA polymerase [Candidatus Thorarchaeota archaeon]RLI60914.1 MAG: DNA-directed RNA polymerase [Candidatus Thorarchaeota archaeon]HDD67717.1 DNA-directed RNA polymerase [Candidatus Thorarchaeota archaeon]
MYSIVTVRDVVRIPPSQFGQPLEEAAMVHLRKNHENVLDRDIGLMIAVIGIDEIGQGRLVPGDGATYHSVTYRVLAFKPIRGEVVEGNVVEIMDFGAFIRIGPLDGLCHVSQICDDFITQDTKGNSLMGKETGRILQEGDQVRARITTISFDTGSRSGKLGLTMRQPFLGKIGPDVSWVEEDVKAARGEVEKKEKKK